MDSELSDMIRTEIEASGPVSFARFMELALYHPVHGYYQQPFKQIGCQGDFYTSVSVGRVFGELLAFQFAAWLEHLEPEPPFETKGALQGSKRPGAARHQTGAEVKFQLVEAGAHDGQLASDILSWLHRQRAALADRIEYWILEPSAIRRRGQEELLKPFAEQVSWYEGWDELPPQAIRGIIFSNELLDAFPVFRVGWDAQDLSWFEWKVGCAGNGFAWRRSATKSPEVERELNSAFWQELPKELRALLPDGFSVELCPAARVWWSAAARRLRQGKLLTFDYGFLAHELLAPQRQHGTLRAYRRHRPGSDPLAAPGTQDLTAHVHFTEVKKAGEDASLVTEYFGSQAGFLTRIAEAAFSEHSSFGPWEDEHTRQFQTLTHPDHLGRSFQALVQGTG